MPQYFRYFVGKTQPMYGYWFYYMWHNVVGPFFKKFTGMISGISTLHPANLARNPMTWTRFSIAKSACLHLHYLPNPQVYVCIICIICNFALAALTA